MMALITATGAAVGFEKQELVSSRVDLAHGKKNGLNFRLADTFWLSKHALLLCVLVTWLNYP
jgi:hypothetical protein